MPTSRSSRKPHDVDEHISPVERSVVLFVGIVFGGALGAAVVQGIIVFLWPPIIAAISARRFPTLDSADATRSISAGWSAIVLLGTMLFEITVILPRYVDDSRFKFLLSLLFIAFAVVIELVLWRMARARIEARMTTLNATDVGDSLPRATFQNFVRGQLSRTEIAALAVIIVVTIATLGVSVVFLWLLVS